nr:uncharacterized protein LOC104110883 [Nicotiana tomentosiformis]
MYDIQNEENVPISCSVGVELSSQFQGALEEEITGDSDNDSRSGKRAVTLDDFELPENFSQIVKFGEVNEDETTHAHQGRTRVTRKHTRIEQIYERYINAPANRKLVVVKPQDVISQYILGYRLVANIAWDKVDFVIIAINIVEKFHWLLVVSGITDRVLHVYNSMVYSQNHKLVEFVVDKFAIMIPLYLSCIGFYDKRSDIIYKNTKAYIEKGVTDPLEIQWLVGEIPRQKEGSFNCGVYVTAFAEDVSIEELSISNEDLYDIDQHRKRYGALLWDYARKKQ